MVSRLVLQILVLVIAESFIAEFLGVMRSPLAVKKRASRENQGLVRVWNDKKHTIVKRAKCEGHDPINGQEKDAE